MRRVDQVPILRARSSEKNDRLVPADLIDNGAAVLTWQTKYELRWILDSLQPVAAGHFPEISRVAARKKDEARDNRAEFENLASRHSAKEDHLRSPGASGISFPTALELRAAGRAREWNDVANV